VLCAHVSATECTQAHDHYLKGTVYCGHCGSRLIIHHSRSHTGTIYPYSICAGRNSQRTNCTRKSILITRVGHLLVDNCHDTYTHCDDTNRRLFNQAPFEKVYIDHNDELQADLANRSACYSARRRPTPGHSPRRRRKA